VKKNKPMSSQMRRKAAAWASYYRDLMKRPVRGIITYGGGLNILAWIEDAEADGYHCTMTPAGVVLR
jgi:hypothetical protein